MVPDQNKFLKISDFRNRGIIFKVVLVFKRKSVFQDALANEKSGSKSEYFY